MEMILSLLIRVIQLVLSFIHLHKVERLDMIHTITSTVFSVYYDNQTDTSPNDNVSATGATTAQLQQTQDNTTAIFSGWDFVNVWDPCSTSEYPRLRWEPNPCGGTSSTILVTLSPDNLTLNENSVSATITTRSALLLQTTPLLLCSPWEALPKFGLCALSLTT